MLLGFRPLTGSYISQKYEIISMMDDNSSSFRPLTGSYISQHILLIMEKKYSFPSPNGELHFSILKALNVLMNELSFPSPNGELHFSNVVYFYAKICIEFPSPNGELHFSNHPCNPAPDLEEMEGLRGKHI